MIAQKIKDGMHDLNKPIEKVGYLQIKSNSWFSGWEDFYVVLKDGKLKIFQSDRRIDMKVPKYVFNMDHFSIKLGKPTDEDKVLQFNLQFNGNDHVFEFQA